MRLVHGWPLRRGTSVRVTGHQTIDKNRAGDDESRKINEAAVADQAEYAKNDAICVVECLSNRKRRERYRGSGIRTEDDFFCGGHHVQGKSHLILVILSANPFQRSVAEAGDTLVLPYASEREEESSGDEGDR